MSSEYGWPDSEIGELPLARFRQITATIQLRRFAEMRMENSRFSWMTRNLAGFIAAGYMVAEGKENTALKQASMLSMDDIESAHLKQAANAPAEQKDNGTGSYEKLLLAFGAASAISN